MTTRTKKAVKRVAIQFTRTSTKKTAKQNKRVATPAKRLSQIEAVGGVLRTAGELMTCKQVVEAIAERKLWTSPAGKKLLADAEVGTFAAVLLSEQSRMSCEDVFDVTIQ